MFVSTADDRAVERLQRQIDALTARVAHLEAAQQNLRAARFLSPPAVVADVQLLAIIVDAVQGHVFSSRELQAHATVHPPLAQALGTSSAKRIGKRLQQLADRRHGPYRLVRVERDRDGVVWAVVRSGSSRDGSTSD
jgi:hypothetical protein